ncbi:10591_t:CDS:2, partial [Funneliformis geosporum]
DFDEDFYYCLCDRYYQVAIEAIKETLIEEISSDESEKLDNFIEILLLKFNEEEFHSAIRISIKLHLEHNTLSNILNMIKNKASQYAILDDQGIQEIILNLLRNKKVQLSVGLEILK